jgi:hypothetical protein
MVLASSLQAGNRVIEARIITGDHRGDNVLIPRLALDHEDRVWE